MTTSLQRIIDNLRSDNPSQSIYADLDGLIIDIKLRSSWCCYIDKNPNLLTFNTSSEIANYLEQNYV
jgi:hypothetical protein